jgi:proline iminopeptidase
MSETIIKSDGANLWTISQGKGMVIILCNGGPGCCDYLGPVAALLHDMAQVIRFEQRGCGRSEAKRPYDLSTCILDLENIRKSYGISQWIVGGHSWGSDLAIAYALAHPDRVLGILAISGGVIHKDPAWREQYHRLKDAGLEIEPEFQFPHNLEVNREVCESWYDFVRQPELLRRLALLHVPSLFVYGGNDIRPSWPVEQLAQLMPKAEFIKIPEAGHSIWLSHQKELRQHLRVFVEKIAKGLSQSTPPF